MRERGGLVLTDRGRSLSLPRSTYLKIACPGHISICGGFAAIYGLSLGRRREVIAGLSLPILHFDIEGRLSRLDRDWRWHQIERAEQHMDKA